MLKFVEENVDKYVVHFEKTAVNLGWQKKKKKKKKMLGNAASDSVNR